jgi:hypothetical protein
MPSTTQYMRDLMEKWFGEFATDSCAMEFLQSHGYVLLRGWIWELPCESHTVSCYEAACIRYLVEEWDFGAIAAKHEARQIECLCGKSVHGSRCYDG